MQVSGYGDRQTQNATKRRTVVDYRFHTKEQQDFYETVLLDKKPIVSDMRWVDWTYIMTMLIISQECMTASD